MTIDGLIRIASARAPRSEEIEAAAARAHVPVVVLYDVFAKSVATRFLSGELSFTEGDAAMTGLFRYAYPGGGPEFAHLAWEVYIAFDEGEYLQAGEPAASQGEAKTRTLLANIAGLTEP